MSKISQVAKEHCLTEFVHEVMNADVSVYNAEH